MNEHETPCQRARRLLEGATPGPWTADDDGVIETGDGTPVGFVHRHGCIHTVRATGEPCSLADGRLMAAAPDLARDLIAAENEIGRLLAERLELRNGYDTLAGAFGLFPGASPAEVTARLQEAAERLTAAEARVAVLDAAIERVRPVVERMGDAHPWDHDNAWYRSLLPASATQPDEVPHEPNQ